ncbi:hypothetical protein MCC01970_02410 [Bifidobacteriaceae bacterium MCC01970]|nr:hypothetical protein MCC01970_02410 [Bifidobacteriaceae bacterium MCC01970]
MDEFRHSRYDIHQTAQKKENKEIGEHSPSVYLELIIPDGLTPVQPRDYLQHQQCDDKHEFHQAKERVRHLLLFTPIVLEFDDPE